MPYYDAKEIKSKLRIRELFERDGHKIKRMGTHLFCLCPFHEEKTPSCCIYESSNSYRCYGCNTGGDIIKYWEKTRACSFNEALPDLASLAGVNPCEPSHIPRKATPRSHMQAAAIPKPPTRLTNKELSRWARACEDLANSPEEIHRIAAWRGFSEALILWAAKSRLIGLLDYMGELREAFMVKAPTPGKHHLTPISFHLHLAASSSGNLTHRSSWRFNPKGQRAWPFIIGTTHLAKTIYLTEGAWDALALCQIMAWYKKPETFHEICVLGLRGASSGKLISHYTLNPKAHLIALPDNDRAGKQWFVAGGLLDQLKPKVRQVHGFLPNHQHCDLNDRLNQGLTKDQLLSAVPDYPSVVTFGEITDQL